MYRIGERKEEKGRHKKRKTVAFIVLLCLLAVAAIYIINMLKPETSIKQSAPVIKKVSYEEKRNTIKYEEDDFTIELPPAWQKKQRPPGPYKSFTWFYLDKSQNSEDVTVYQDVIPPNFAVNRVVIVEASTGQVNIKGGVSDNCSTYTKNVSTSSNQSAAPAKWEGIDFLCDQGNKQRDILGTSSKDGVNVVNLKSPTTGKTSKFFFTYHNRSIKPDYTVFTDAISSFRMK